MLTYRLVLLLGVMLFTQNALAAVGRIYYVSGGVYVERGKDHIPVEVDMLVESGDTIVTEHDGRVQWRLNDDSYFVLKPESKFKIEAHSFPDGGSGQATGTKGVYELIKGGMRTLTGLIASNNKDVYQTKTPVATIGIRGTDYTLIFVDAQEAAALGIKPGLYIRVDSGAVVVTNSAGSIEVKAGQYGFVEGDKIVPTLLPDAPPIFINWAVDFALKYPGLDDDIDKLPRIEPIGEEPCVPVPSPNQPCPSPSTP